MGNRVYFGRDGGDDGITGRGGESVSNPEPVYCDECDEQIVGEVVTETTKYANGHVCVETFHAHCHAVRVARRAA